MNQREESETELPTGIVEQLVQMLERPATIRGDGKSIDQPPQWAVQFGSPCRAGTLASC